MKRDVQFRVILTLLAVSILMLYSLNREMFTLSPSSHVNKVVVTPAGRKPYLEILVKYLAVQKPAFTQWHLWKNTSNVDDIRYMESLARRYSWIKVVDFQGSNPGRGNLNIGGFFQHACVPGSIYLRLDDDIVYLDPNFIESMFRYRMTHIGPPLVYSQIVNNNVIAHLQQKAGLLPPDLPPIERACMGNAWRTPKIAERIHRQFLADCRVPGKLQRWMSLPNATFDDYVRVSINCICWFGADFQKFNCKLGHDDEEQWLSVDLSQQNKSPHVMFGGAICAHYAFYTQRPELDKTDILQQYARLAPA